MERRWIAAALACPLLLLSGCGDDTGDDDQRETTSSEGGPGESQQEASSDEAAVEDTIVEFLLTGDCELATDDYLLELDILGTEETTPQEACARWEQSFVEPQFDEGDIKLTELAIEGDVATVQVGSDYVNVTTLYQLTLVDGTWLVSGDEYNTDGL